LSFTTHSMMELAKEKMMEKNSADKKVVNSNPATK
jgi:hypothetical protein